MDCTTRPPGYSRLDQQGQVYLDYTGASLYADSQIEEHLALLRSGVLGNPHSANPTSIAMTNLVERTRAAILDFFHAPNYHVVFTQNATGALKLVGESFPFENGQLLLSADNHNSVNGMREFARKQAKVSYLPLDSDLRLQPVRFPQVAAHSLFAFPAQSNYTGVQHPLSLIGEAQEKGWRVLLDAAAFVPTNRLNLTEYQPDFVCLSFYKMFGYPTGIGALLIHKNAIDILRRPWFAGGTVKLVSVQGESHALASGEAAFEDGTLNYLAIPAVEIGLRHLKTLGLGATSARVQALTAATLERLQSLRHQNGKALLRIYGPQEMLMRGSTITMNLYDRDGIRIDFRRVEELAGQQGISLRGGCFCNPGANEFAEELTEEDMRAGFAADVDVSLPGFIRMMQTRNPGKSAGAIRASLGIASNQADVDAFLRFLEGFLDQSQASIGTVTIEDNDCRIIRDGV
ncbi:aminotransferase class V-fold PLP-dependent enzyme [Bryobacter aggregatus]|uniref:aminotransferase class V-fold PLP-dependent enzyme n=1 Tax=Bryobacter aggregatus TaxID=360054 RepID=UPI00068BC60E|nr:aminotransferase class V-fold PLP-dependent enzyme [Bryobacter aggregatus]